MNKRIITKDMVREGYLKRIITIEDDALKHGCDGICCMIGDNAFYFGSIEINSFESAKAYIEAKGIDSVIDEIYETLNECIKIEFEDEYEYYYLVLKEKGE